METLLFHLAFRNKICELNSRPFQVWYFWNETLVFVSRIQIRDIRWSSREIVTVFVNKTDATSQNHDVI